MFGVAATPDVVTNCTVTVIKWYLSCAGIVRFPLTVVYGPPAVC